VPIYDLPAISCLLSFSLAPAPLPRPERPDWRLLRAGLFFGDAFLQRVHQIYHGCELGMSDLGDFVALTLGLDHILHAFHVIVFVLVWLKGSGQTFDQLRGELFLGILGLSGESVRPYSATSRISLV
jgi:hypothetical protein